MAIEERLIIETGLEARIADLVEPVLQDADYQLVRVRVSGLNGCTVQIMVERPDQQFVIEDCEKVTRMISPVMDVEDILDQAYHLEVSSPGMDRPLVRRSDFEAAIGHLVKIGLSQSVDSRKRLKGEVKKMVDDRLVIDIGKDKGIEEIEVALSNISEAKLVLTDELIKQALKA